MNRSDRLLAVQMAKLGPDLPGPVRQLFGGAVGLILPLRMPARISRLSGAPGSGWLTRPARSRV
jgi:hypothetical protein